MAATPADTMTRPEHDPLLPPTSCPGCVAAWRGWTVPLLPAGHAGEIERPDEIERPEWCRKTETVEQAHARQAAGSVERVARIEQAHAERSEVLTRRAAKAAARRTAAAAAAAAAEPPKAAPPRARPDPPKQTAADRQHAAAVRAADRAKRVAERRAGHVEHAGRMR